VADNWGAWLALQPIKWGFRTVVFTDQENSPASFATNQTIVADYSDEKALKKFADLIDVATFEFENIPVKTVEFLSSLKPVFPNAEVLKTTQHRILEKTFLNSIGVKTADFAEIKSLEDLQKNLKNFKKAILKDEVKDLEKFYQNPRAKIHMAHINIIRK